MSDEASLLIEVRQAADELLGGLNDAQERTNGWADAQQSYGLVEAALAHCLGRLATTGTWGEANRTPSSELWRIAGGVLKLGWLQNRARSKPRGYAGDFELLERICRNDRCEHPLGRLFDAFFQNQAAPRAVRNRTQIVAQAMVQCCRRRGAAGAHLASVGSGSAIELQRALANLSPVERSAVRVTLLDMDPVALDRAAAALDPLLPPQRVRCVRENLFRLPTNPRVASTLQDASLIVCCGLFDYLDAATAASMLAAFWRRLADDGRLQVFNFSRDNPSRAYMEWIGNWYLIYRDRAELNELALAAGLPRESFSIDADPLGVNLFISARRDPSI